MPIINTKQDLNVNLMLSLRLFAGLIWLGTVIRRFSSNYGDFKERITSMADGTTIFPDFIMEFAVKNWIYIYLLVVSIEIISSISLLFGVFARGGALLATINGFAIGMAGVGLGIQDLLIPWSVAIITLFLLIFTHPGRYKGVDAQLINRPLPKILFILT
ncbi:MAG: hypothetical protein ACXAD7_02415 [Candidatus Kariarchaeaceae archaeon]|jgi:uncharacterized membrane protein YphA (DoxX/SURF4 family)